MKNWLCPLLVLGAVALGAPSIAASEDDDASLNVAILDILLERGIIDSATYEELLGLAQLEAAKTREFDILERQLKRMKAPEVDTLGGQAGKLMFASPDGAWSMGIKGRIQVQFDASNGESGNRKATYNNFSVRRTRLAFYGNAGGEGLTYKIEWNMSTSNKVNSDGPDQFELTDAYLDWLMLGGHDANAHFRAGQFKFPFGREIMAVSSRLNLVDESIASKEFAPDREPGAEIYGRTDDSLVEWWVALSNGEGRGAGNSSGTDGSSASSLRHGARIIFNPLGRVNPDMSAFQTVNDGGFRFAFGGSYMMNPDQPFDADGDPDTNDSRTNNESYSLEGQVLWGPASIFAEYYSRDADVQGGGNISDTGYTAQAGVFVLPNEVEVALRTSRVKYDKMPDVTENSVGVNYYLNAHKSKLALDFTDHKQNTTKDFKRFRAQYQLVF